MNSLISIIVPIYNRENLIKESIDSIIQQTYKNWECIIVDDGSTDSSIDIIRSYIKKDNRVKLFFRDRLPKGAPTCRNIGIENSKGEYIVFLDSDDLLSKDALFRRMEFFEKSKDYDLIISPLGHFTKEIINADKFIIQSKSNNELDLFLSGKYPWQTTAPTWKKQTLLKLGGWDENLVVLQDVDLHIRACIADLRYSKFDGFPDCFYRHGNYDKISTVLSLNKVNSFIYFWFKIFDLLKEKDLLNNERIIFLSKTVKNNSLHLIRINETRKAFEFLKTALNKGVINTKYYLLLKILLKLRIQSKRIEHTKLFKTLAKYAYKFS